jgi:hypothetical protein
LVALVLLGALAACKADATVTVRMREDGSGVVAVRVVLDEAAVRAAEVGGGKLADRVRLADLTGAGWTVTPWRRTPSGGAVISVTKPFSRPEQVRAIVGELNGAHGPLRGFRASRDASTFSTTWKVAGTVDLRRLHLGIADDEQLVANLTNERVDVAGVEPRIAASALAGLQVRARVELPGGDVDEVRSVPGERAVLHATADDTNFGRLALVVTGVLVALLAVVLLVVGETRARRRRSRRSVPSR